MPVFYLGFFCLDFIALYCNNTYCTGRLPMRGVITSEVVGNDIKHLLQLSVAGWRVVIYMNKRRYYFNSYQPPTAISQAAFLFAFFAKNRGNTMKKILCLISLFLCDAAFAVGTPTLYYCNCGPGYESTNIVYNRSDACKSSSDTECIVSSSSTGFVYRLSYQEAEPACGVCQCYSTVNDWEYSSYCTVKRTNIRVYDSGEFSTTCNYEFETDVGCDDGCYMEWYDPQNLDIGCTSCPRVSDDWTDCYGKSKIGNKQGIDGCWLPYCGNMEDETGAWVITEDEKCFYQP